QIKKMLLPKKIRSFPDTIKEFDQVYVAFPEKAELIFQSKEYHELKTYSKVDEKMLKTIKDDPLLDLIDQNSVVFANQKYNLPINIHVKIIMKFLKEKYAGKHKIFIK